MMLSLKKNNQKKKQCYQWCAHTSVPNGAQCESLIYQHHLEEVLWSSCFWFQSTEILLCLAQQLRAKSTCYVSFRHHFPLPPPMMLQNLYVVNFQLVCINKLQCEWFCTDLCFQNLSKGLTTFKQGPHQLGLCSSTLYSPRTTSRVWT